MQVYELADELGVRSIDVLDACAAAGVPARDAGARLDDEQADRVRAAHRAQVEAAAALAERPRLTGRPTAPSAAPAPAVEVFQPLAQPHLPATSLVGATALPPGWVPPGAPPQSPTAGLDPGGRPPSAGPHVLPGYKPPMHPLVKKSILYFVLAQVVPCIGIYFFFASYSLAGKGRRQIMWYQGRWGGDSAALVIQILFWVQLVISVLAILAMLTLGRAAPPASTVG